MTGPTSPDTTPQAQPATVQPDRSRAAAPVSGQPEQGPTPAEQHKAAQNEGVQEWIEHAREPQANAERAKADLAAQKAAQEFTNAQAQGTQSQEGNRALLDKLAQQNLPDRVAQVRYVERQMVESGVIDDTIRPDAIVGAIVRSSADVDGVLKDLGIPARRFAEAVEDVKTQFKATDAYTNAQPPINDAELTLAAQRQILAQEMQDQLRNQYQIRAEILLENADPKAAINQEFGSEETYDRMQEEVQRTIDELRDKRSQIAPEDLLMTDAEFEESLKQQPEVVLSTMLANRAKGPSEAEAAAFEESEMARGSLAWKIAFVHLQEAFPQIDEKNLIALIQDQEHLSIQGAMMQKDIASILASDAGKSVEQLSQLLSDTEAARDAKLQAEFAKSPQERERKKQLEHIRDEAVQKEPWLYMRILKLGRKLARHKETLRIATLDTSSEEFKTTQDRYTGMQSRVAEIDGQLPTLNPKSEAFQTLVTEKQGLQEQLEVWTEAQELRQGGEVKVKAYERNVVKKEQSKYDDMRGSLINKLRAQGVQIPDGHDFINELRDLPNNPNALGISRKLFGELFSAWKKKRLSDLALVFKLLIGIIFSQGMEEMNSYSRAA